MKPEDVSVPRLEAPTIEAALENILEVASAVSDMFMADLQLVDFRDGSLRMAAQRGCDREFLQFFARVRRNGGSACGRAINVGRRVVAKVEADPLFDADAREMMLSAGSRLVQSTPILHSSGRPVGMFSTHYKRARSIGARESAVVDSLVRAAGAAIRAYNWSKFAGNHSELSVYDTVHNMEAKISRTEMRAYLLSASMERIMDDLHRIERGSHSGRADKRA